MVEEKDESDDINQEAVELSLIQKEKGNVMFKKGNYKRAIQYYTRSKELDPTNPVFPLNRAMAYLKLKKYSEAENDCTDCLALSPKNVKALYRRGLAKVGLKKYLDAKTDFEAAIVLEPSNKQAKDELNKVLAILKPKPKPKEEPKPSSPINNKAQSLSSSTSTKYNQLKKKKSTITKEQEEKLKNKPVRRRLQITEVGRTQEEIQKQRKEELLKQMDKEINEINELINSSEDNNNNNNYNNNNNNLKEITLTDKTKEDSITPLDMVQVSTTRKTDTKNTPIKQKSSKIIEIVETDRMVEEINDNSKEKEEQENSKKKLTIVKEIKESSSTPTKMENIQKSNELLSGNSNKSTVLSSFILNKENENENEKVEKSIQSKKEKTEINSNKSQDQKKSKLNKKRSIIIEEVDEIIAETSSPLNSIGKFRIEEEEEEEEKEEEEKEKEKEGNHEESISTNTASSKSKSKIEMVEEIKDEENIIKENSISNDVEELVVVEPIQPKKIRPKVKVATTMYEFERDWKSMKNNDEKTFEYLSSIIPENLPSLFKNSFESDYFSRILVIMNKFYIKEGMYDEMYALLNSIQKVKRFEMTLMFMTRKDKQALENIFNEMKINQSNSTYSMSDLEILAKKYKISF
ncbi:hypothetical protein U3516DRAFT_551332 [Neocallimastix sp. 'constans']